MIKDYFRYTFPLHLRQLHGDHPFFLGNSRDTEETSKKWSWEDVIGEMQHIAGNECPDFVCCLFFVLMSEQAMLKYLEHREPDERKGIMYPEFALSGRSEDYEAPIHLLSRAGAQGIFDGIQFDRRMDNVFEFMVEETKDCFARHFRKLDPLAYFESLRREPSLQRGEGHLVEAFQDFLADLDITGAKRRPQSVYVYFFSEGAIRLGPFQTLEWTRDGRLVDQNKTEIARFNPPDSGRRTWEILYDSGYEGYQINGLAISTDPHQFGVRDHQGRRLPRARWPEDRPRDAHRRRRKDLRKQAFRAAEAAREEEALRTRQQPNLFTVKKPPEESNDR